MSKPRSPKPQSTSKTRKSAPAPVAPWSRPDAKRGPANPRPAERKSERSANAEYGSKPVRSGKPALGGKPERASKADFSRKPEGSSRPKAPAQSNAARPAVRKGPVQGERKSGGPTAPGALINRRAADRLRSGYLWVYSSDIESIGLPKNSAENPPALLPVADSRGLLLGTALYSPTSQIALRMISRDAIEEPAWLELLAARLRRSIERRALLLDDDNDACRLCFSEADELPGLVVDKYGDLIILQLLAKGLDSEAVRETCVRVLCEELSPAAILERPDPRMRELEAMAAPNLEPLYIRGDSVPSTATKFYLNGLVFRYDANSGQKTGAFLDQRTNYAAAAQWAQRMGATGRALDVCCYQGGFALHLAQVCGQVTGIDASRSSLEVAELNLEANRGTISGQVDWVEADAFQILRDWCEAGETFDTIVLDPPAFAKSMRAVEGALRGYKEMNLRALKMLRPGGLLVTCSCSHHVGWAELEGCVTSAAIDASRRVRLLERRGASPDHPVVLNLPETEYLKCLVLEVE